MRRRIVQMAWGLFALSLIAGWHDTARGEGSDAHQREEYASNRIDGHGYQL